MTDRNPDGRNPISAFLVDRDTPGFNVLRKIPMIDGTVTYEIVLEDCRVPTVSIHAIEDCRRDERIQFIETVKRQNRNLHRCPFADRRKVRIT